jgi:GT2 family glycosyltransferase
MTPTRPTMAVVICAYTLERWADLREAVASATAQVPAPDELLLVVDHNAALLDRAAAELVAEFPGLEVVPNRRKQGLSGARNTAVEHVRSEVVVFLDDDARAEPGWLARLAAPYADGAAVIGVGGAATPRWSDGASRPPTLPAPGAGTWGELDWVVGCSFRGLPTATAPVRNLMGCNMSLRRDVFAAVGGFSEDLGRVGKTPLGCEETELCIRASADRPGSRIVFEPLALVRHHVSDDRLTWRYLLHRCLSEGVSKAAVAAMVGPGSALATERGYVTRVLPQGLLRNLVAVAAPGAATRATGLLGASAIVAGLTATGFGYARGRLSKRARTAIAKSAAPQLVVRPVAAGPAGTTPAE